MTPIIRVPPFPPARQLIRLAGTASVLAFLLLAARFWHPIYGFTYFLELGSSREGRTIAAFREDPVFFHPDSFGYDGQYYAQIAHHPALAASELRPSVDALAYRGRRILVPALAWLVGVGRPAWITQAYSLINVGCWLALAALLWRLFNVTARPDWHGWVAWFGLMFSAGALVSVRLALTDLPALLLVAAGLYAAERRHGNAAVAWLAAASLARESSLAAWPIVCAHAGRSARAVVQNALRIVLAAAPLLAWTSYVTWRAGRSDAGGGNFAAPLVGLIDKWRDSLVALATLENQVVAWTTALAMLALLAQVAIVVRYRRPSERAWRMGVLFAAFMLTLGPAVWEGQPGAALRVLLPLNLAANLIALNSRAPIGWLLACNLTVFSGVLTMQVGTPLDIREVASARVGDVSTVLQLGDGWDGWEHDPQPSWGSTEAPGYLIVRAWPASADVRLLLTFTLSSPKSSVVTITGPPSTPLWSGQLAEGSRVPVVLPITVSGGRLDVSLTMDSAQPFGPPGDRLGLAMFDPQIQVLGR